MKYLIYLRVSTDEQDEAMQKGQCLKYVSNQENAQYEIFSEGDMSSGVAIEKRLVLQQMLAAIRPGNTVLVYKLDRMSRDIIEMVQIYREIIAKKALCVSLNDPYQDEFSIGLMGLLAQRERDTTRKRVKDALSVKRDKGERVSRHLPYGYGMHETALIPIKDGTKTVMKRGILIPQNREKEAVGLMVRYFGQGLSYLQIARQLTDQGYLNREGRPFQKMTIYRILQRLGHTRKEGQLLEV